MDHFFGYYFKHQKNGSTIAFIPGLSEDGAFIQMISPEGSFFFPCAHSSFRKKMRLDQNVFSKSGVRISLPGIHGYVRYGTLTPLQSDVMGFFRFLPMECRHKIISMRHDLKGTIHIFGTKYDLTGGTGYIEGDSGHSFPSRYLWIQANDFPDQSSITLSLATLPLFGFQLPGAFAILHIHGKEVRFATYYGCSVTETRNRIFFRQREFTLVVVILSQGSGYSLSAPGNGRMIRSIKENNNAVVRFTLYRNSEKLWSSVSYHSGYERYPFFDCFKR